MSQRWDRGSARGGAGVRGICNIGVSCGILSVVGSGVRSWDGAGGGAESGFR